PVEKRTTRWRQTRTSSFIVLAFFPMFFFPKSEQIWPVCQKTSDPIDVLVGDGLQDDAPELVFQNLNLGAGFDLVFAAKLRWNHKLALRCECRTQVFHVLHYSKVRHINTWDARKDFTIQSHAPLCSFPLLQNALRSLPTFSLSFPAEIP